jgi:hypothetical protein
MQTSVNNDVCELSEWLRNAWRNLADPKLTSFDRRETRNAMKEVELALSAGFRRIADKDRARRDAEKASMARQRLDFRIIHLDL